MKAAAVATAAADPPPAGSGSSTQFAMEPDFSGWRGPGPLPVMELTAALPPHSWAHYRGTPGKASKRIVTRTGPAAASATVWAKQAKQLRAGFLHRLSQNSFYTLPLVKDEVRSAVEIGADLLGDGEADGFAPPSPTKIQQPALPQPDPWWLYVPTDAPQGRSRDSAATRPAARTCSSGAETAVPLDPSEVGESLPDTPLPSARPYRENGSRLRLGWMQEETEETESSPRALIDRGQGTEGEDTTEVESWIHQAGASQSTGTSVSAASTAPDPAVSTGAVMASACTQVAIKQMFGDSGSSCGQRLGMSTTLHDWQGAEDRSPLKSMALLGQLQAELRDAAAKAQRLRANVESQNWQLQQRLPQHQLQGPVALQVDPALQRRLEVEDAVAQATDEVSKSQERAQGLSTRCAHLRQQLHHARRKQCHRLNYDCLEETEGEDLLAVAKLREQISKLEAQAESSASRTAELWRSAEELTVEVKRLECDHYEARQRHHALAAARTALRGRLTALATARRPTTASTPLVSLIAQIGKDWADAQLFRSQQEAAWQSANVLRRELLGKLAALPDTTCLAAAALAAAEDRCATIRQEQRSRKHLVSSELAAAVAEHRVLKEAQAERRKAKLQLVGLIEDLQPGSRQSGQKDTGEHLVALKDVAEQESGPLSLSSTSGAEAHIALRMAVEENDHLHKRLLELQDDNARLILEHEGQQCR